MRLIDADELRKSMEKAWISARLIDESPTVDAVPVVRCKDCIGKANWYKNDYGCTICGLSGMYVVDDNSFCSYGEPREDKP